MNAALLGLLNIFRGRQGLKLGSLAANATLEYLRLSTVEMRREFEQLQNITCAI